MAENNICIRAWKHCAHPLLDKLWLYHSSRMSLYIYNTREDIDKFFEIIDNIIL
jgi:cysteine desulfurase/selenocysteine lyase